MSLGIDNASSSAYTAAVTSNASATASTSAKSTEQAASATATEAVAYDKAAVSEKKATYSINQMSKEDRASLVQQLKADQASRQQSLLDIVNKTLGQQAEKFTIASLTGDDDSIWKKFANGEFKVDEATRKQAQEDISEDGYWGVKQTSQRLFDFASALAGDDVDKMKEMQAAVEKGYKEATKAWGRDLPSISNDTIDATNKLFEEYYKSKEQANGVVA
ncbi:MAG: hypothetical protein IJ232_11790 [Lachnospiraceae bacterium]|nr:hypothetical protein [Lachnospiraceae bacterium]